MLNHNKIPRRIITGKQNGKSVILEDATATNVIEHFPGLFISDLWTTDTMPVVLSETHQIPNYPMPQLPHKGSLFRHVIIPPDKELGLTAAPGQPHPLMHETATLDYIIILSGEIYLIMEEGETLLRAGDLVVQRGTNHAWSNRSEQPCIQIAIVLDAASPLT